LFLLGLHKKLSEFITEICHSSHKQTCGINPEVLLKDLRSNNINVPNIIAKDKDNDLEDIDWSFVA
jgi:hypothetical protein